MYDVASHLLFLEYGRWIVCVYFFFFFPFLLSFLFVLASSLLWLRFRPQTTWAKGLSSTHRPQLDHRQTRLLSAAGGQVFFFFWSCFLLLEPKGPASILLLAVAMSIPQQCCRLL